MTPAKFIQTRRAAWDRCAALVLRSRRGAAGLSEIELQELARLYPTITVDIARARLLDVDRGTQQKLNQLAIGAHGLLYGRTGRHPLRAVGRFFSCEYPALFRRLWPYFALATAVFLVMMLGGMVAVLQRPSNAYLLMPQGLDADATEETTAGDVSERYRQMPGEFMQSYITTNNISVAFMAFAMGILVGLGTVYVLIVNGLMLGTFIGHFVGHGFGYDVASFLIPHGALEIFAILVAATAGMRLGLAIAMPGGLTRRASLRVGGREAVLLVLGTIPMFVVAGIIESYITPSYLPGGVKIAIGLLALGATLLYLATVGRPRRAAAATAPAQSQEQ